MNTFSQWLAYPQALALLAALPLLAMLGLWAWFTRRRSWRLLGSLQTRTPLATGLIPGRLKRGILVGLGLFLAGLAAAGPQWGREPTEVQSAGRDLVVLLDVSRSMLAETPSRQLRAQRLLSDLAHTFQQRGGHRVALIAVAAKAQLVMPLTTDYDLFELAVRQQDAARLPAELRPGKDGPASGTRLGEGLKQAIAAQSPDPRHRGSQVILLVSDGDDPADDGEWKEGATAARQAGIPVFVAGVGDPKKPSNIRIGDQLLTFNERPVETTLNEDVLKEIAKRTDGAYFPVQTADVVPGALVDALLEAAAAVPRETPPAEDYAKQFRWFLSVALILLGASLLVGDRWPAPAKPREGEPEVKLQLSASSPRPLPLTTATAVALAIAVLIGAAPEGENLVRQGNEAFQHKDYESALKFYEQAEERTGDPGLVAFNKGATLIRLGQLRKAELCYLRCLQDGAAPAERRLKAYYDLGTALLQHGGEAKDLDALVRAGECFDLCFKESATDKALREDSEHNMDLARLLWLKVRAELKPPDDKHNPDEPQDPRMKQPRGRFKDHGDPRQKDQPDGKGEHGEGGDKSGPDDDNKLPGSGSVQTLPDSDEALSLDSADARDILARIIQRIENDRTQSAGQGKIENRNVKDW